MQVKGYAAPETKAAIERARVLIDQAEARGEPLEDSLLLFSVLYSFWAANFVGFNGDALRALALQFLALAEKQKATGPLMVGHRLVGTSLACTGDIREGRAHLDRAAALYDAVEHRSLALRFGQDVRVAILSYRGIALWMLGYPAAALLDADQLLADAREIDQATTLMYALTHAAQIGLLLGNHEASNALAGEAVALAEEKRALLWQGFGIALKAYVLSLSGHAAKAVQTIIEYPNLMQPTGARVWRPYTRMILATAHSEVGHFDEARRQAFESLAEIENYKERWWEAEANRIAGEIARKSSDTDAPKAEAYFERALAVARRQQAKSWELRAALSMARLWRDQGKRDEARELLAPIYGWFTEGFDTRDLKEARALLDELAA
jgi:predicted ATPase